MPYARPGESAFVRARAPSEGRRTTLAWRSGSDQENESSPPTTHGQNMKRSRLTLATTGGLIAATFLLMSCTGNTPKPTEPGGTQKDGTPTELVGVAESDVKYQTPIESNIGGKKETLVLTGTAVRQKFLLNVYAIGSYIQDGVKVTSAAELCNADCGKQLHLVMERAITGKQMADALSDAIRRSHPEPEFNDEIGSLSKSLQTCDLVKGDQGWLTNVPGMGLNFSIVGKFDTKIESPAFARAIWEVYLGHMNIGESIKAGLVSRLK